MAIISFTCPDTEAFFESGVNKKFSSIANVLARKLNMLNAAAKLEDLRVLPGNKLHYLDKDRHGQYAINVNRQYRICFEWTLEGPKNVEVADYH